MYLYGKFKKAQQFLQLREKMGYVYWCKKWSS